MAARAAADAEVAATEELRRIGPAMGSSELAEWIAAGHPGDLWNGHRLAPVILSTLETAVRQAGLPSHTWTLRRQGRFRQSDEIVDGWLVILGDAGRDHVSSGRANKVGVLIRPAGPTSEVLHVHNAVGRWLEFRAEADPDATIDVETLTWALSPHSVGNPASAGALSAGAASHYRMRRTRGG